MAHGRTKPSLSTVERNPSKPIRSQLRRRAKIAGRQGDRRGNYRCGGSRALICPRLLAFVDDVQTFYGETPAADVISAWSKAFREHPDLEKLQRTLETLTARFAPLAEVASCQVTSPKSPTSPYRSDREI